MRRFFCLAFLSALLASGSFVYSEAADSISSLPDFVEGQVYEVQGRWLNLWKAASSRQEQSLLRAETQLSQLSPELTRLNDQVTGLSGDLGQALSQLDKALESQRQSLTSFEKYKARTTAELAVLAIVGALGWFVVVLIK